MKASSAARTSSSVHVASSTSSSSSSRARVIESRIPSDSGGVRRRPSAAQKNVHVGPSSTRPCGRDEQRLVEAAPRARAGRRACWPP